MLALPEKFLSRIAVQWGEEARQQMENAMKQPARTSVRLHPRKTVSDIIGDSDVPWCPYGRYFKERPVFTLDPLFHAGIYYVQEASSMFLWQVLSHLVPNDRDMKILDLCGAPGGKSSLIASFLDESGLLVCNEVIKSRAYILRANMEKAGYLNTLVTQNDPKDFAAFAGYFDIILVDAPCSGEGMFRKDDIAIREWSEENVNLCSARQKRILADVLPALKSGGHIVYSTCTYNDSENIDNVIWAVQNLPLQGKFVPVDNQQPILRIEKNGFTGYQFSPHLLESEGLFISILQKTGTEDIPKMQKKSGKPSVLQPVPAKITHKSGLYIDYPAPLIYYADPNEDVHAIPAALSEEFLHISQHTRIIHAGVNMGKWIKEILLPHHALALCPYLSPHVNRVELSLEDSLKYLNKSLQRIENPVSGWLLVTYQNHGLGWIKNLGNRINNYLPNEAKIKMDISTP
jgi:16S rRNA C967 or C1407 C5-methylase (RsmB/RsmF family)/NOL1/NOP2/fmu family ribosome biogenesis protein